MQAIDSFMDKINSLIKYFVLLQSKQKMKTLNEWR